MKSLKYFVRYHVKIIEQYNVYMIFVGDLWKVISIRVDYGPQAHGARASQEATQGTLRALTRLPHQLPLAGQPSGLSNLSLAAAKDWPRNLDESRGWVNDTCQMGWPRSHSGTAH